MTDATTIRVETSAAYDVVVGHGLLSRLPGLIGPTAQRVAVLHAAPLQPMAESICPSLARHGYAVHAVPLPVGERAKTAEVAADCWSELGRIQLTRSDVVVSVGGGATSDLAGFVAATWLRGVRVVHVPTTLLGMVDAAIGGKTGINTADGKNLVGSFHEPAGVLCDLAALQTLPRPDLVSGLAEVVKCGFVADTAILDLVEGSGAELVDPRGEVLRELVERSVRVKAAVVAGDLRETGSAACSAGGVGREALNYGHTYGHALERVEAYRWRHGAAVSVGLVFVAALARLAGRLDRATADRHRELLSHVGLPVTYGGDWPRLLAAMRLDKKARGDRLRFVVLDAPARPAVLTDPDPALLAAAHAELAG